MAMVGWLLCLDLKEREIFRKFDKPKIFQVVYGFKV